jgi:hypothetical protein
MSATSPQVDYTVETPLSSDASSMINSRNARAPRRILGVVLAGLLAPLVSGCGDNSTGTPPVMSDAEIKAQQERELEARKKAYGGRGIPTGRNPGKAAGKAAEKAAPAADKAAPAADKAAAPEAEAEKAAP